MALQNLVGAGIWLPMLPVGFGSNSNVSAVDITLDADEEEFQVIGRVRVDGGGSKTFGTSGSKIAWLPGASITFQSEATLRVGVKKSTTIDATAGPAARATIGAAAFDVYDDLIGGTDTITSTTWREETMSAGTPFTVANGDLLALCWHLDIVSAAQSVKIRSTAAAVSASRFPASTLVTSGPTYTAQTAFSNAIITFDDGTLGWLDLCFAFSVGGTNSATIGNGNIYGNVFQVPFSCKVDGIAAGLTPGGDFALDLWETPLGTPSLVESISFDANILTAASSGGIVLGSLATPRTLTIGTDYVVGVKQTSATAITVIYYDVNTAAHFKPNGMGAECYAANSTAGATFSQQNSGKRRYLVWARISALDDGVSAGGTGRGLIFGG